MSDDVATVGRRDRRKQQDRGRLLAAARVVIAEQGVANLRINDVTARADIGFGTFYSHFASKDAIIEAVVAEAMTGVAAAIGIRALQAEDPAETAAISYRRFVRFAQDDPQLAGVLISLDHADALFEDALLPYARETLERGIASGRFRIDDVELALTSVSAAALAAIRGVVSGRVGPDAGVVGAEMMLRAFGLDLDAAAAVSRRELPPIDVG